MEDTVASPSHAVIPEVRRVRLRDRVVAARCDGAYPGGVPHTAVLPRQRLRARRRVVGELSLGLLLGVLGGWVAGLVRVRRP